MEKLISVVMPSYNRKNLIEDAVNSIIMQKYRPIEVIIIDDNSSDGTYEFIEQKYKENDMVHIVKNEKNMGAGASRKKGYNISQGEYIVFMDDDDYYTDFSFFDKAVQIMEEKENIGMVSASSTIEYVQENRTKDSIMNIEGEIKKGEYLLEFQRKYMKSNSTFTTVFRRKCLEKADFDKMEMVNDSSIYLRALLEGDAYVLKDICGIYRIHSKNITFNLNTDFILENLTEKKSVYDEIVKRNIINESDEWLKSQVLLTLSYFLKNNKISDDEYRKIINWCNDNCKKTFNEIEQELAKYRR